jgi:hypothetical protein
MRPRFAKPESGGGFFGGDFGEGFNYRTKRIAHFAGILAIRMVNVPQLVARFQSCGRVHAHTSAQSGAAMVYLIHKMHGQSL